MGYGSGGGVSFLDISKVLGRERHRMTGDL